jgi:hypothetical protein
VCNQITKYLIKAFAFWCGYDFLFSFFFLVSFGKKKGVKFMVIFATGKCYALQ